VSLKGRLRRLDAGVRWLETEGVFIRWELRMKLAQMTKAIDDHRARVKALPPAPKPILRDAPLRGAPQDEAVRVEAKPHLEERPARPRLEGCEPALPGQPTSPPSPEMEIRPVRWRARTAQDYDEEERPGTNGRCITEYDPLRDPYDDDDG
jgi:hypothetical protein